MPTPSTSTSTTAPSPSILPSPTFSSLHTHLLTLPAPLLPPPHAHSPRLTPLIAAASLHPSLEAAFHILNHDLPSAHFLVRHMEAAPAYEGMLLHGVLHRVEGDYDNARAWYADVRGSGVLEWVWGQGREGEKGGTDTNREERLREAVAREKGGQDDRDGRDGDADADADATPSSFSEKDPEPDKVAQARQHSAASRALRFIDAIEALKKRNQGDKAALEAESRREIEAVIAWCAEKFGTGRWQDASEAWVKPSQEVRKMGQGMVTGGEGWREF